MNFACECVNAPLRVFTHCVLCARKNPSWQKGELSGDVKLCDTSRSIKAGDKKAASQATDAPGPTHVFLPLSHLPRFLKV